MEVVLKKVSCDNFNEISMFFDKNKITSIYDENNSGLLEIIALLKPIKSGIIEIDNSKYDSKIKKIPKKIRRKIGFISRLGENQFFNETVKEEIEISLKLQNINIDENDIVKIIEMVNLDKSVLNRNPFTLSDGEKRKLSIACALIYNPEIIIIENPFLALDFESKNNIYKLLKKLKDEYGKTIIVSSNDIEEIYKISDYVYILKENEIILHGERSIIYKQKEILLNNNIYLPQVISFSDYVLKEKNVKLGYRYEINDLIKDIYRNAR